MAYISKTGLDNFFQIFFMGTSWVALAIKNIKNSSELRNDESRKTISIFFIVMEVNVAKHWHVAGRGICYSRIALFDLCPVMKMKKKNTVEKRRYCKFIPVGQRVCAHPCVVIVMYNLDVLGRPQPQYVSPGRPIYRLLD